MLNASKTMGEAVFGGMSVGRLLGISSLGNGKKLLIQPGGLY